MCKDGGEDEEDEVIEQTQRAMEPGEKTKD